MPDAGVRGHSNRGYGARRPAQVTVTVLDQTGAALIIASVTLVDPAGTPVTRTVDERGQATFEGLTPGTYQLKADAEAFQSLRRHR